MLRTCSIMGWHKVQVEHSLLSKNAVIDGHEPSNSIRSTYVACVDVQSRVIEQTKIGQSIAYIRYLYTQYCLTSRNPWHPRIVFHNYPFYFRQIINTYHHWRLASHSHTCPCTISKMYLHPIGFIKVDDGTWNNSKCLGWSQVSVSCMVLQSFLRFFCPLLTSSPTIFIENLHSSFQPFKFQFFLFGECSCSLLFRRQWKWIKTVACCSGPVWRILPHYRNLDQGSSGTRSSCEEVFQSQAKT